MGLFTKRLWPSRKKMTQNIQSTQKRNSLPKQDSPRSNVSSPRYKTLLRQRSNSGSVRSDMSSPRRHISIDNPLYSPRNSPDKLEPIEEDRLDSIGSTKDKFDFDHVSQRNFDEDFVVEPDIIYSENMDFKNISDFNLHLSKAATDKVLTFFNKTKDKIREIDNDIIRLNGILDNYNDELKNALIKKDAGHKLYSGLEVEKHEEKHITGLKKIIRGLEVNIENLKKKKNQLEEGAKNKGKQIKKALKFKELLEKEESEKKKKNRWKFWKKGGRRSKKAKTRQCRRTRRRR